MKKGIIDFIVIVALAGAFFYAIYFTISMWGWYLWMWIGVIVVFFIVVPEKFLLGSRDRTADHFWQRIFLYADLDKKKIYKYPKGYKVKSIVEQIEMIAAYFNLDKSLALSYAENLPNLRYRAEGWFAMPKWQSVAPTYEEAVEKLFSIIGRERKFCTTVHDSDTRRRIGQADPSKKMMAEIEGQQKGDIVVVQAQFGFIHRYLRFRDLEIELNPNEFGLGVFAVGCLLLTHPKRERLFKQIHAMCIGDEVCLWGGHYFDYTPYFFLSHEGVLYFREERKCETYCSWYGAVTGFKANNK